MASIKVLIFGLLLLFGVAYPQESASSRSTGFCEEFVKSNEYDCSEYMLRMTFFIKKLFFNLLFFFNLLLFFFDC